MSTVPLDTHVVHWWSAEPQRISGHGLGLVTKDQAIRDHAHPRSVAVW